jgi:metal-responsive CopG/Arc/MetJ family transcriptional regulator
MSDNFVVTPLRGEDGTTVVTARLPDRLVQRLEDVVTKTGRSRTQVIIMALDYALDRLKIEELPKGNGTGISEQG